VCTRNSMDHGRVIQHEPLPIIHAGTLNPPVYSPTSPRQCGFFLPKLCLCTLCEHGCTSSHRLAETVSHRLLLSSPCFSSRFFADLEYVLVTSVTKQSVETLTSISSLLWDSVCWSSTFGCVLRSPRRYACFGFSDSSPT
jgi:hypothetical protein